MIKITKNFFFSYNSKPKIIAEISGNHGGKKTRFLSLIKHAFKNGADLVKIQTYEPIDITLKKKTKNYKIKSGIWKGVCAANSYKFCIIISASLAEPSIVSNDICHCSNWADICSDCLNNSMLFLSAVMPK